MNKTNNSKKNSFFNIPVKFINKKISKRTVIKLKKRKIYKKIGASQLILHKGIIFQIISDGALDEQIYLLDNIKVEINSSLVKKRQLTAEEQFICIIDSFISYFTEIFPMSSSVVTIVSQCVKSDENNTFLSKKYYGDYQFIDYFLRNYNLMIVNNFYYNYLNLSKDLEEEFKKVDMDVEKVDLKNDDSVYNLILLLEEICFINKNNFAILSLFSKITDDKYLLYKKQWEILLSNYLNNEEMLCAYRKFRKKMIN